MVGVPLDGFEIADDTTIWRYLPLGRFRGLLTDGLYLSAVAQFLDRFEGSIGAEVAARRREAHGDLFDVGAFDEAFENLKELTMVSCWHASSFENIAMWERYRQPGECTVAVRSTVGALKAALGTFRLAPTYGEERVVVAAVQYVAYDTGPGPSEGDLERFLFKRLEYSDEREVRVAMSLRMAAEYGAWNPVPGVFADVDLRVLISEVRVGPDASADDREHVADLVANAGLSAPCRRSVLSDDPFFH